jgi:two-component system sensor histidine kinase KdpD
MLDRAQQLKADGVDVVAGFIETHGRAETAAMMDGLEILPRRRIVSAGITYEEFDRDALLARKPGVALIDELAHTNAPGSAAAKRYEDVLAILRSGIDVITTLNIQHLEALSDAVFRLTGTVVRETLPDGILALAHEVILIDVTPETLRDRLRAGKIYPPERIEAALANFFRIDNLLALRELALREALRAQDRRKIRAPFERLLLSVAPRAQDVGLIKRCSRIAARLQVEFAVALVTGPGTRDVAHAAFERALREAAANANAAWIRAEARDVPSAVLRIARERKETTIAVAGTLRAPGLMHRKAFARRLLDAGALELLILTPRETRGEEASGE